MEDSEKTSGPSNTTLPAAPNHFGWRHVQTLLLLMGMTIGLSLRVCLSVAIVAMRNSTTNDSNSRQYNWDQSTATIMLGSFFWGYTVTQFPAGYLVQTRSALNVLTLGILSSSVVNMLTPLLAELGYVAVICGRVVMGLGQGCMTTCILTLISRWVPPMERARLGSTVINGMPLGTIIGLSVSGLLAASPWGWPSVFYFFGAVGIGWSLLFFWLGADYPSDHSMIGSKEVEYINASLNSLNDCAENKPLKVPWSKILRSVPLWAAIVAGCGNTWGFYTFVTQLPSYLKYALDYDISESGTVSALPYIAMWLMGFPVSFISDYALRKGAPTGLVRKTCAVIGLWTPAACMLFLGSVPTTNKTLIVGILVVAIGFNCASTCSTQINYIDLAPNYVAPITSFGSGIAILFSLGIPYLFKFVITDPTDVERWRVIFFVTAGIYFFSNLIFLVYGRCEPQPWNNPDDLDDHLESSKTRAKTVR